MKKIICLIVFCMLITCTAGASDLASIDSSRLSFDIFRYISSGLIMPEPVFSDTSDKIDVSEDKSPEKPSSPSGEREVVTMRDVTSAMCIAESVSKSVIGDEEAVKVEYYKGSDKELRECYFTYKSYTKTPKFTYEDISKGSLFYVSTDSDGLVSSYSIVAVINRTTKRFDVDFAAASISFNSRKTSFSHSYITDIRYKNGVTSVSLGNGSDLTIPGDATAFTYDNSDRNPKIYTGDFTRAGVDTPTYDEENDVSEVYMVFAVNYDDETVAICSVAAPAYVSGNVED